VRAWAPRGRRGSQWEDMQRGERGYSSGGELHCFCSSGREHRCCSNVAVEYVYVYEDEDEYEYEYGYL
jgi:hypothetical protein